MSESKELTVIERAALALGADEGEKQLISLAQKYTDITDIKNPAGRTQCHAAAMELSNARIAVDKTGKAAREDANAFQKAVIAEVARRVAIIKPEEDRLLAIRDTWDAEREREKEAKVAAEKARIEAIQRKIEWFRGQPANAVGWSAKAIAAGIETLECVGISLEEYAEFAGEAEMAKIAVVAKLGEMLSAQVAVEAESARIAAEREQLARERAEAEERERIAAQARAEQEAKDKAERERVEAEQRAAQEKAAEAMRQQQAEHEARMRAQQEEIDRQQAEINRAKAEQERAERERQAAIEVGERRKREEVSAELHRQQVAADQARREQQERERAENLAARYSPEPTGGTWSIGKTWGAIVSTAEVAGSPGTGHNDAEYYGGNMICESVWRPADAHVLAAAHDMFSLLKELIDIEGPQPGTAAWAAKVKAVLVKATYVPEVQPEAQAA